MIDQENQRQEYHKDVQLEKRRKAPLQGQEYQQHDRKSDAPDLPSQVGLKKSIEVETKSATHNDSADIHVVRLTGIRSAHLS